ncbi:MAG: Ig-like domain-containing protein, partial [Clostridiales bacterium]|nr:Ig-like domain-containing protein [Clostridiales bacterium]
MRKFTYWLIGLAVIGIVIGSVLLLNNTREISLAAVENALVEPTLADTGGVDISSAFRFIFTDGVSANAVRRFLVVEPAVEFNFHQGLQAKEVLAVPVEPLQPGQIYRFALHTEAGTLRWAFQTKQEWRVEAAVPGMADVFVRPDSGLNIYFNQSIAPDFAELPHHFLVEPQVDGSFEQEGNCLRFIPEKELAPLTVYTVTLLAGLPSLSSDLTLAEDYSFAFETANTDGSAPQALWYVAALSVFTPEQHPAFDCDFFDRDNNMAARSADDPLDNTEPRLNVTLYRYPDAKAYAEDILLLRGTYPFWSHRGLYPQEADTSALTRLFTNELYALSVRGGYRLSWPSALPTGCYLLQASYRGQSRDIRFQISDLTAFLETSLQESLFWINRTEGIPAAGCQVTHINSGATGLTDEDGLLRLELAHDLSQLAVPEWLLTKKDVYLLRQGSSEFVLTDFFNTDTRRSQASVDIWQYTVLSQDTYNNGDTLDFWGYMRRRDNAEWEWNRVSVYICGVSAPKEPVWQGYAPLNGNIFHGSLPLPRLTPGQYELQIWQSGQMLISKGFAVEEGPLCLSEPVAGSDALLAGDKDFYALQEEYTLRVTGVNKDFAPCLFIKSGNGLKEALVERQGRHTAVFSRDDLGGAYWQAAAFGGGHYYITPCYSLLPETLSRSLHIEAEMAEGAALFTVKDAAGTAHTNVSLLAMIAPPGRLTEDMAAALYAPNRANGLLGRAYLPQRYPRPGDDTATWDKKAICFAALESDKNGRAELELPDSLPLGEWRLYIWAVVDDDLPLAAHTQIPLDTGAKDDRDAPPLKTEGEWLFISGSARLQAMELLELSRGAAGGGIKERWAALYADGILAKVLPEYIKPATDDVLPDWNEYQDTDGGLLQQAGACADMFLSLQAAALEGRGTDICDKAALTRYFKAYAIIPPSQTDRAMALAALAILGQPVLQEIKLTLAGEDLPPLVRTCL